VYITVTHWDGVKGIESKVAKQKHLLQTAPELQIEKVREQPTPPLWQQGALIIVDPPCAHFAASTR
jgi:hypothetical protein